MKTTSLLYSLAAVACLLTACGTESTKTNEHPTGSGQESRSPTATAVAEDDDHYIPVDSANKMIGSYLGSISGNDSALHSLILDANVLRSYLNSDSGQEITQMKIMFAHKLTYINDGGGNKPCGYNYAGLTLVLAGFKPDGSFILGPNKSAIDNAFPCPANCSSAGQAADDYLPQ